MTANLAVQGVERPAMEEVGEQVLPNRGTAAATIIMTIKMAAAEVVLALLAAAVMVGGMDVLRVGTGCPIRPVEWNTTTPAVAPVPITPVMVSREMAVAALGYPWMFIIRLA